MNVRGRQISRPRLQSPTEQQLEHVHGKAIPDVNLKLHLNPSPRFIDIVLQIIDASRPCFHLPQVQASGGQLGKGREGNYPWRMQGTTRSRQRTWSRRPNTRWFAVRMVIDVGNRLIRLCVVECWSVILCWNRHRPHTENRGICIDATRIEAKDV
jgi:hypothetical protein